MNIVKYQKPSYEGVLVFHAELCASEVYYSGSGLCPRTTYDDARAFVYDGATFIDLSFSDMYYWRIRFAIIGKHKVVQEFTYPAYYKLSDEERRKLYRDGYTSHFLRKVVTEGEILKRLVVKAFEEKVQSFLDEVQELHPKRRLLREETLRKMEVSWVEESVTSCDRTEIMYDYIMHDRGIFKEDWHRYDGVKGAKILEGLLFEPLPCLRFEDMVWGEKINPKKEAKKAAMLSNSSKGQKLLKLLLKVWRSKWTVNVIR